MRDLYIKRSDYLVPYEEAIQFMEEYVLKVANEDAVECVWFLEHPPLLTLGTSAEVEELIAKPPFPIYKTNRGGRYTYHGPGQRIVYIMLNLKRQGSDVRGFVRKVEQWLINSLKEFGLDAQGGLNRVGVWLPPTDRRPESKIAAMGFRVRKGVTYHGIALNVCPNLNHFQYIVPCGIRDLGVTSLEAEGIRIDFPNLDKALAASFRKEFGFVED